MSSTYRSSLDHTAARPAPARSQSAGNVSRHVQHRHHQHARGGYTLQHAGHQVRIGPVAFWIVVGALVAMAVWSVLTGTYFAFREDVLTGLIGRQAKMQFAYEDRIAELRAQIDRITSRQLLDQEQFEQQLKKLLQRQATLERRTDALSGDALTTGSIPPTHRRTLRPSKQSLKPSPISDTVIYVAPPDREARLQSREAPAAAIQLAARGDAGGLDGILTRVSAGLDKIAHRQSTELSTIEEHVDSKARTMHGVLADLGIHIGRLPKQATGGPLVPIRPPQPGSSTFDRQLYRINVARAHIDHYKRVLTDVPVRKPVTGRIGHDLAVRRAHAIPSSARPPCIPASILRGETRRAGACHRRRQSVDRRPRRRLRQPDRDRPWQRAFDPLRSFVGDRREGRPEGAHRPGDRQDRLDRALHRSSFAL